MKFRQKPSGIWIVEFSDENNRRRRVSTGIKTVKQRMVPPEVKAKGRDIVLGLTEVAPKARQPRKGDHRLLMRDLFDKALATVWSPSEYKSQDTILSSVKILNSLEVTTRDPKGTIIRTWIFGDEPAADITYSALRDVAEALKSKRNYAPGSIKRQLDNISKALKMGTMWTDDAGKPLLASKPVIPAIRVANRKDRVIHGSADHALLGVPDEEATIFAAIETRRVSEPEKPWFRIAALLRFLLDVGGRLGESLSIGPNGEDIGFQPVMAADGAVIQRPVVTFPHFGANSGKPRTIPLTDAAWAALQSQREHAGLRKISTTDGPVQKLVFFPLKESRVWYMFDQIKQDLAEQGIDLSDVTLHTFRHTCLSRLARGGMDLLRLQNWAGHSDLQVAVARYGHLIPSNSGWTAS